MIRIDYGRPDLALCDLAPAMRLRRADPVARHERAGHRTTGTRAGRCDMKHPNPPDPLRNQSLVDRGFRASTLSLDRPGRR